MLALAFAAFLLFGVALVLVGASQDAIAAALGIDLAASGLLASALALGLGAGMLSAGPLVDRFPRRPLLLAATLASGLALVSIDAGISYPRLLLQLFLVGWGGGVYDVLLSVVIVERFAERAARRVSLVHAAATLGAMSGPALASWLEPRGGWAASFAAAGIGYLAFAVWAAAFPLPPPRATRVDLPERAALWSPALFAFGLIGFAYLGVETAATLFAVPYATDGLALEPGRGRSAISSFWLGVLAGRAALVLWPREADARWLVASGTAGAALVAGSAALAVPWIELVFALCGACVGAVFPLLLTLVAQAFPRAPALATALVAGGGELGGIAVPWLHGALGDRFGIRASVGGLALWLLVLGLAGAFVARLSPRAGSASRTRARR